MKFPQMNKKKIVGFSWFTCELNIERQKGTDNNK